MDGVIITPLKKIYHPKGNVFHAIKKSDNGFYDFGEAYFSTINKDDIKGWKKHANMILNIIVPIGEIEFVIYSENSKEFLNIKLSQDNYQRLTIQPNLWVAFKGKREFNMLLNIANIEHTIAESETINLSDIIYDSW